jgi:serine/threonine-protein kinase
VSSLGSVRDDLGQLGDPDLRASLAAAAPRPAADIGATATYAPSARRAGERFRILRFHREGGLGRVYVARDEELGRDVALKEIRPDKVAEADLRERCVLEAEINGGLEHPGVVPVYSLGTYEDGRPFYAMRLVEGDSVKEAIESYHKAHPRPDPNAVEFRKLLGRFIDVCEAIAFAHSKGVLHRDLKPHNVMLGRFGETLLIDWGLAKATGRREPAGPEADREATLVPPSGSGHAPTLGVLGSPQYMSPEQAGGATESLGPSTDVYGLGAILFALLTGEPPVQGGALEEVLERTRRGAIRSPRSLNPNLPRALEAVCLRALALKPEERYPSALALAEDIEHWLADESVAALPDSLSQRLGRWARRHRAWVQAALLAIAVVATAATVRVNRALRRERQSRVGESRARLEAEGNFQTARHAVDESFTLVSEETLLDEPSLQPLRRKLLQSALAYHERFLRDHSGDENLQRELARSRLRLADITNELGRREEALARYLACRPWFEGSVREHPDDVAARGDLVRCLIAASTIQTDLSQLDSADDSLRLALRLLEPADNIELKSYLAKALHGQARLADAKRHVIDSHRLLDRAVALQERLVSERPERMRYKVDLTLYYLGVAQTQLAPSRRSETMRMCRRACEIEESFLRTNPDSILHRFYLGCARYGVGHQQLLAKQWSESAESLDAARVELERVVRQNPGVRAYRLKLADACDRLGFVLAQAGASSDSVARALKQAALLFEELHQEDPKDRLPLQSLARQDVRSRLPGQPACAVRPRAKHGSLGGSPSRNWLRPPGVAALDLESASAAKPSDLVRVRPQP